MNKKELFLRRLQLELKNFGLNPSEWSVCRMQALGYRIQNKFDKNFTLYGRLEYRKMKPQWKSLEVMSI